MTIGWWLLIYFVTGIIADIIVTTVYNFKLYKKSGCNENYKKAQNYADESIDEINCGLGERFDFTKLKFIVYIVSIVIWPVSISLAIKSFNDLLKDDD